jgi:predicted nucleic acid-binding protein
MRTFVDTNIFLYAAGSAHPRREGCIRVLQRVADGTLDATVNSEVIQEILYVLSRREKRDDALTLASHVSSLFTEMLPVTRGDIQKACELLRLYPGLAVRDAIHAATMIQNGIHQIISVDEDFDQIRGIRRIDPSAA